MISGGDGHDDSNDPLGDDSNVVPLKVPRKKARVKAGSNNEDQPPTEPLINLPPFTKYILLTILGVHLIVAYALDDRMAHLAFIHLGFIPGRFSGTALFEPLALLTPFTHMFLHGSWLHIAMNGIMLLAFGSGVEKWLGGKRMIALFVVCGLFGVAAHMLLNFYSIHPVIGASGGLSGLFAAAVIMINRSQGGMSGRYGIWPFIALWIGISVLFGLMGSPDGGEIAWAAHVGGFLGGFAVLKLMKV